MANFFKSMSSNALSEKGFPGFSHSKASCSSSSRFNNNMTRNTNMPVVSQFDHDATASVSPITKEIDTRLKVLNKILPHEQIVELSQEFINRLNSACFEKIAETVNHGSNSVAPSASGGASSVCSSIISQQTNIRNQPLLNGVTGNRDLVTQMMFKAAKSVRAQTDLGTINEEPQAIGLAINSSREKSKIKSRSKVTTKPSTVLSSQNENDSTCFRKPVTPVRSRKPRSNRKETDLSIANVNRRKKKIVEEVDTSTTDVNLTITKTSLRSNAGNKRNVAASDKQTALSKKNKLNSIAEVLDACNEDEEAEQRDDFTLMLQIQGRPKKTALSPFFNRFKKRCSASQTTSTPFKR